MRRAAIAALLSHWRRQPMQLAMLLIGLSLATALWSGVQAVNTEARASYDKATAMLGANKLKQIVSSDGSAISQAVFVKLRRAGWAVSPFIEGDLRFGSVRIHLIGIDPVSLPSDAQQVTVTAGGDLLGFVTPPGRLYLNAETAASLANQDLPPFQISEQMPLGTAIVDIGEAQRLLGKPDQITRLVVGPQHSMLVPDLSAIAPGLAIESPDAQGDISRLTDSFHLNLTAFGMLAFVVGLFIVYSAIGLAFEQRRPTFRTLRALGVSAKDLTTLLVMELLVLATVAGTAGVALGYLVASVLLPGVATTLHALYGANVPGTLSFRPQWWASGLAIAIVGTLISAAHSLWQVSRMPLLAPAQPRAWARASQRSLRLQAFGGLVLLTLAAILMMWGNGLIEGFAILGCVLLGAALILPVILDGSLSLMQKTARGVLSHWFWADARQQLPGLSLALMALLLALAANVGVGTMVSSFRLTFTGWLDQRLAAQLYITARSETEGAAMIDWVGQRVDAVLPNWNVDGTVEGQPGQVYGIKDDPIYRSNWPMIDAEPDVWDEIAEGRGALINEQLSRRSHLRVGDTVDLPGNWKAPVVGVYSDYGNPIAQAIIGIDALNKHYPDVPKLRYGLRMNPAKAQELAAAITEHFGLPSQNVVDQAKLKRRSLEIFEKTFAVTAVLNVMTLGVAALAMFASLMTLSTIRLPQLAPVWAMGLTRRHLALLELARTLVFAAFTFVAAIPVGIGLAWVLLSVVNVNAFGWQLPMHIFPGEWVGLGLFALLAAFVAAAIPVRKLSNQSPSSLLKVFSNER
jgi:putative ABC transport system permease protein